MIRPQNVACALKRCSLKETGQTENKRRSNNGQFLRNSVSAKRKEIDDWANTSYNFLHFIAQLQFLSFPSTQHVPSNSPLRGDGTLRQGKVKRPPSSLFVATTPREASISMVAVTPGVVHKYKSNWEQVVSLSVSD